MKIISEKTAFYKYAFEFNFNPAILKFCQILKKDYGWKNFAFIDKKWRFNDPRIGLYIRTYFSDVEIDENAKIDFSLAEFGIQQEEIREQRAEEIKKAEDSDIEIPGIKGELYPYQKVGVEFFANSNGRAILSDTMGLGKTVQALAYLLHANKRKVLVVCPASVKHAWEDEIDKWTDLKYLIVNSKTEKKSFLSDEIQIFVLNYDVLIKFYETIMATRFDCCILDEFQYIKNSKARRTKLAKIIASRIPSLLLLSGTPILSRPIELFNGLNLIDPRTWNSYYDYSKKFCNGHQGFFGWDDRGASNIDELQTRISKYFLRRTKDEVLKELPEKVFTNLPIDLDKITQKEYDMALKEFGRFLKEVKGKKTPEIMRSLQAEKLVKLGALRQITTRGKILAAEEIIQNTIDSNGKMLVFSCYNEPLEILYQKFKFCSVILTGKTSEEERANRITWFQNDPKTRIFFGGIKSAGIGITLTAASTVLFIDLSWCPADHSQAMDRCLAKGQEVYIKNQGLKSIENVSIGDLVLTHKNRYRPVINKKKKNWRGKMTEIQYFRNDKPIICTYDHKILIKKGKKNYWIPAYKIMPGDLLVLPKDIEDRDLTELVFPQKYCSALCSVNNWGISQKKGMLKKCPSKIKLTKEILYMFGWYLAEGCTSTKIGKGAFISFSGHLKELKTLQKIQKIFQGWNFTSTIFQSRSNAIELRVYSLDMAKFFKGEFGEGCYSKKIPEWIFDLPVEKIKYVFNGYTDGDGYRRKNKLEWVSVSKNLAYQMTIIAAKLSHIPSFREVHNNCNVGQYIGQITFKDSNPSNKKMNIQNKKYIYYPVKVVKNYSDKIDVYDLTIKEDHSFVTGFSTVHNCHRPGQTANKINIYYLYALNTVDEYMTKLLERKQLLFNKLIEGTSGNTTNQSIVNNVLRMIERKTDKKIKGYEIQPEDDGNDFI